MSILIIDDEVTARDYLYHILINAGYHDIREAGNGAHALQMVQEQEPDIIIADIRMPEIDGIELLRILRDSNYKTIYILLSGYEIFSSAQEALRHNAYAYLLKPVSDEELLRTVEGAMRQLELHRLQENKSVVNERNNFISSIIFQRQTNKAYIKENSHILLSKLPYSHYAIALFRIHPQPGEGLSALLDEVEKIANNMLLKNDVASFSFIEQQSLILLLSLPAVLITDKGRLTELFRNIKDLCRGKLHPNLHAAVGYVTGDLSELHASYQYAYRMLKQEIGKTDGRITRSDDSWSLAPEQLDLLLHKLKNHDVDGVRKQLADLYAPFFVTDAAANKYTEYLRNVTLQVLLLLTGFLRSNLIDSGLIGEEFTLYQEVSEMNNAADILNWIRQKADRTLALAADADADSDYDVINHAREYILEHLGDPLTLEGVAGSVYLSPGYFSRLFKEQTGISFIQYVTGTRINEAKRLLMDPHSTAKDVGELVGYRDIKHFYKVFKSATGLTPGAYRKHFRKK